LFLKYISISGLTVLENKNKAIVGTPNYMSPEQYEGQEYDKKTDIWALGCIVILQNSFLF